MQQINNTLVKKDCIITEWICLNSFDDCFFCWANFLSPYYQLSQRIGRALVHWWDIPYDWFVLSEYFLMLYFQYFAFFSIPHGWFFWWFTSFISSPPGVFLGKGVLKRCSKFMGEHPCRAKKLYWNHTLAWVFPCKVAAYFQNTS